MNILIVCATRKGSTAEMAHFIADRLRQKSYQVTVASPDMVNHIGAYDAIILGSGAYKGMWLPEMLGFVRRHLSEFGNKPVFGWLSCIRILEEGGYEYVMTHYLPKDILARLNVKDYRLFAGRIEMQNINLEERWTLALHYDGKASPRAFDADYRDWNEIGRWADHIAAQLQESAV